MNIYCSSDAQRKAHHSNLKKLAGLSAALMLLACAARFCWADTLVDRAVELTDEEKMEQVREYFKSPYQEEDYFRTDRLLVTATGVLTPLHKAPSVATVITAEDIERSGAKNLGEALEMVPGLHVAVSNKNAMSPVYSFRGIHTSINPQVLMMINSIPIKSIFFGSRPQLILPVAGIARIEVVRGPGSAVHGADAFAGTINVITKELTDIEGSTFGVGSGSFGSRGGWIQHGKRYGDWDLTFSLERQAGSGDKGRIVAADLQSILDTAFGTTASHAPGKLDLGYDVHNANFSLARDHWSLRLWGNDATLGPRDGVIATLDNKGEVKIQEYLADLSYRADSRVEDLELSSRISFHYYKQDSKLQVFPDRSFLLIGSDGNIDFSPAGVPVSFPEGVWGEPVQIENQAAIEVTGLYEGLQKHRLRLSTGFEHNRAEFEEYKNFGPGVLENPSPGDTRDGVLVDVSGTGNAFMPDTTRKLWYATLQDEWAFARKWELTAGVRYDEYSDFGSTVNPRLALVWETRYDLTTKLLYGSAFRPPSLSELYVKNNPANTGNPDLDPETIDTYELVFDYQPTNRLHTIFNVFRYEIRDLIELDTRSIPNMTQNSKNQEGYGFEIELDWKISDTLRLRSNVAYQRSEDKQTGAPVPDAPNLQFFLSPSWSFLPRWQLEGQYYWIGDRKRAAGDTRSEIKDYDQVNLTLRRAGMFICWDVELRVRNLFDADIREPSLTSIPNDYPMEGRSIYGELRYHF